MITKAWEFHPMKRKRFTIYFHFVGWASIQLGIHFDFYMLNMELHLPFCFIRLGYDTPVKVTQYKEEK